MSHERGSESRVLPIFVYGTLKRGECRERCWPHPPLLVEPAEIRGELYDLGPYPAAIPGNDTISGELWHVSPETFAATVARLDEVEGVDLPEGDLYRREIVSCSAAGVVREAYVYFFARLDRLAMARRVLPDRSGACRWPSHDS